MPPPTGQLWKSFSKADLSKSINCSLQVGETMKEYVIHATRSYFVMAKNESDAEDKFFDGQYHDKSDEDIIVEEWK